MKVLTLGTFDLLHYGHLRFLKRCAAFGELIVALNTDEFVARYKGTAPVMTTEERMLALRAVGYEVTQNNGPGKEVIMDYEPDLVVIGSDWARKDYLKQINMTQDELDEMGTAIAYVPYTNGISSTEIRSRWLA